MLPPLPAHSSICAITCKITYFNTNNTNTLLECVDLDENILYNVCECCNESVLESNSDASCVEPMSSHIGSTALNLWSNVDRCHEKGVMPDQRQPRSADKHRACCTHPSLAAFLV